MTTDITPELAQFNAELADRFKNRLIKRYVLPKACTNCAEVFVRELTSRESIDASIMADSLMSGVERSSKRLADEAEKREQIRVAICGFGDRRGDAITYRHVNVGSTPLAEINEWGKRYWDAFEIYFNDVNGMPMDEFLEGLKGASIVGAFAPPASAIPASASDGRLAV